MNLKNTRFFYIKIDIFFVIQMNLSGGRAQCVLIFIIIKRNLRLGHKRGNFFSFHKHIVDEQNYFFRTLLGWIIESPCYKS